jgi:hypothetical protein
MEFSMSNTTIVNPLRQRMIADMAARLLKPGTRRGYIRGCRRFAAFLKRSPVNSHGSWTVLRPLLAPLPRSPELLFPVGPKASWTDFSRVCRRGAQSDTIGAAAMHSSRSIRRASPSRRCAGGDAAELRR